MEKSLEVEKIMSVPGNAQKKKLREIIGQLKKASKTHLQQANKLEKLLKRSKK